MEIKHIKLEGKGAFIVKGEHKRLAEMTYVAAGDSAFIIDHTEVDESLRGQKVGNKLVEAAVAYARENGLKIYATCPFALKVLTNTPEYHDVFQP